MPSMTALYHINLFHREVALPACKSSLGLLDLGWSSCASIVLPKQMQVVQEWPWLSCAASHDKSCAGLIPFSHQHCRSSTHGMCCLTSWQLTSALMQGLAAALASEVFGNFLDRCQDLPVQRAACLTVLQLGNELCESYSNTVSTSNTVSWRKSGKHWMQSLCCRVERLR